MDNSAISYRYLSILVILTFSCNSVISGWQVLDFGEFKLKTPQNWTIIKNKGIDSYVGGLTNGTDSLWFDYGWYSVDFEYKEGHKQRFAKDTVNGLSARIMVPDSSGQGYISMYIPKVAGENKFTIWGLNIKDNETILKIFKSLVFKNSDTLINPALTNSKFILMSHGTGKTLYYQNCASCHAINKESIGPALTTVIGRRDSQWLYNFFTNRKSVVNDSLYKSLSNKYENHCPEFLNLTIDDIDLISDYIKTYN